MKVLVYLFILVAVVGAIPSERDRIFCGRALAEARLLLCFGPDVDDAPNKSHQDYVWTRPKREKLWPWLADHVGKRVAGLVDECCLRPCHISQILSYC